MLRNFGEELVSHRRERERAAKLVGIEVKSPKSSGGTPIAIVIAILVAVVATLMALGVATLLAHRDGN